MVVALNRRGRVIDVRGNVYRVVVGTLTMTCRAGELGAVEPTSRERKHRAPRGPDSAARPATHEPPGVRSIDLHGMTVEQARTAVADFLSRAVMEGADTLEIVHGIGTGRVRDAVRRDLTAIGAVRRVRPHPTNPGVTIVHL
jgi:DNA mismatch repair protein MutS2